MDTAKFQCPAEKSSSRKLERREEKVPFSDNRKLRPFWCIDPGVPVNCGHGRRGAAAETLVVGGDPWTGASARGSSGTRPHGADRARVGAPLRELREIRSGGSGANPKGACGEQYEPLCLSGGLPRVPIRGADLAPLRPTLSVTE